MRLALVTDSTSDLSQAQAEALNIAIVPLYVHFRGTTYRDWIEITPHQIFEGMRMGAEPPTTSQPSPEDFAQVYRRLLAEHDHLLSIHLSSKLSGTVHSARLAAQEFPGRVTVIDSQAASAGVGLMVMRARELAEEGRDLGSILAEIERLKRDHLVRFTVGSLEFLQRTGRIGRAQALVGGLLGIKPILTLNQGEVDVAGRVRGEQRAEEELLEAFRKWAQGRHRIRLHLLYSADRHAPDRLEARLRQLGLPLEAIESSEIGAVIATHAGPGTYGYYAYSC